MNILGVLHIGFGDSTEDNKVVEMKSQSATATEPTVTGQQAKKYVVERVDNRWECYHAVVTASSPEEAVEIAKKDAANVPSIVLSGAFRMFQAVMTETKPRWSLFSTALLLVGGLIVVIALLPSSWIEKACSTGPLTEDHSSIPIKLLAGFAVFSYLLTVGFDFAPSPGIQPRSRFIGRVPPVC